MLARALRSSAFSQKSRRWRLRFFVKPRTKYFINQCARKNHTFCKRPQFAENFRLMRKSECGRMRSFGCATLRAAPLRMTERARFARNQESLARGKITLLPKRTPFAVNVRLLGKSECGARINLRSPERRAAERKHDAERCFATRTSGCLSSSRKFLASLLQEIS